MALNISMQLVVMTVVGTLVLHDRLSPVRLALQALACAVALYSTTTALPGAEMPDRPAVRRPARGLRRNSTAPG